MTSWHGAAARLRQRWRDVVRPGRSARRWTSAAAVVVAPVVLGVLVIVYPGSPVARLDLNDGGVWLTNATALKLGRLNSQIDELNGGVVTSTPTFDVLQDAEDVLLTQNGTVARVDPATVTLGPATSVGATAVVTMAAGTVVSVDPVDGATRITGMDALDRLATGRTPDLTLGEGGRAVAATSGAVLAVRAVDGQVQRLDRAGGTVSGRADGTLGDGAAVRLDALTAVGDVPVGLSAQTLLLPGRTVDLSALGTGLVLQQPGPRSDAVLVSGRTALASVNLDSGAVTRYATGGSGSPAAPVLVNGCVHAAWASSGSNYLSMCAGQGPELATLEGLASDATVVFRVNRSVVALNDSRRGRVWLPLVDASAREPNWQDIVPETAPENSSTPADGNRTQQTLATECTPRSAPPTARDDAFGVRPGRTAILPVIDNDSSSDCGILAISEFDSIPASFGTLQLVYGGRELQVSVAAGATGTVRFTYTITDGRGANAPSTATVELTVHGAGVNAAPVQLRVGSLAVDQGGQATYAVLGDFGDPDGDDLLLLGASATEGTVRFRQDGSVTYLATGKTLGRTQVTLVVSDGTATVTGVLNVDVRPAGSVPPVIDPVMAVTYVDAPVTIHPLDSVRSTSQEQVRLAGVDDVPGATITSDLTAGTFTFSAARPGTYYVSFLVTASPQQATGLARIDVREWPAKPDPPIAVRDLALLPPGGEVTVNPLVNDVDPSGGVLLLQSIDVPDGSGLRVAVIGHQLLEISSTRVLEAPVRVGYTVSNGVATATSEVVVQPVPASAAQQAPVVENISVAVRTGGVVTIPVLDHAEDPDGDRLTVVRQLAEPLGPGQGLLFVTGDVLRYQATDTPMTVHATFSVQDTAGNVTSAQLTVDVHASDPTTKSPPLPRDVTARVFQGENLRIPIPLVGIDPDGDGVVLLGEDKAPLKGRITAVGADWIEYEALPGEVGTDTFTYAVEDWVGQRAIGTIRVGISPRPRDAAPVIARDDAVTVRPGQQVEVRVLANDIDPNGGDLTLSTTLGRPAGVDARVDGRRIIVVAPGTAGVYPIVYSASNTRGSTATAVLMVTVDPAAPYLPPVARDVVVPATDTLNRTSVEVDVLAVAQNPSGPLSDLAVSVPASASAVARVDASAKVVVTLVDHAQTLPYLLTNTNPQAGGVSTYAFITVPALGDFPPVRRPKAPALRVASGQPLTISLAEQVQVAPGKVARIADPAAVTATKSNGGPLTVDPTTLTFTSAPGYAGPASITVPVTDGASASDPSARTQVLTLPISVYAVEDYPPTFDPSVIEVSPGEAPVSVDLAAFTTGPSDANGTVVPYAFLLTSAVPAGFTATLEGSVLQVSAGQSTAKGTTGSLSLSLGYGRSGTMGVRVELRVIASSRPLARVVDHQVPDGVEGQDRTVAVLAGSYNPFPDTPLTVVSAVVETPGAGTAVVSGSNVVVRPAAGFIGTMVTRYSVRDATGDPDRVVEGRVVTVVRGRPDAPTAPRRVEVRDHTVVLAWDAPAINGEPITAYRVTATPTAGGAAVVTECVSTTCTLDTLTNNVEYTFTVAAKNAVGWSDDSPPSVPLRPDTRPDAPAAPTLTFGDGQLTATWQQPASAGSPVTSYAVEISPSPDSGPAVLTSTATTTTFTGLTNGKQYTVRVRAVNRAPDPSDWSPASAPMAPAAPPDAPAPTATQQDTGSFGTGTITVAWATPPDHGDTVSGYELTVDGGAALSLDGTTLSYQLPDAQRGQTYTFAVRAKNKAGWSAWGSTTGEIWSAPGTPTSVTATDVRAADTPWGSGQLALSWVAPADTGGTGIAIDHYEVDGYPTPVTGTTFTATGLIGGTATTLRVRACNTKAACSDWAAVTATPTTVPQQPTVTVDTTVAGEITVHWGAQGTGGLVIRGFRYRIDGLPVGWRTVSASTDGVRVSIDPGDHSVEVQTDNALGWSTTTTVAVTTTVAAPAG
jgi:fibronectin type III domain protein/Big-like domain-containing protein